ncbi:hypothetical protein [Streptomyces poriferorum]|uniref:Uncharacterized protein n=1 Tax=Streptomyces poriferorum TaxID=2798799 RepID=A0ABY9J4Q0_9ACTN|nr:MULTISPECIES: hypothetical protein [unclassified Streptomyces]MDP5309440.1 hypothetical protein [Streptomyces sp. Alt4]WLQ61984.1 hypothetical protein P8A19_40750 [Streptomyces sp. Alt2]
MKTTAPVALPAPWSLGLRCGWLEPGAGVAAAVLAFGRGVEPVACWFDGLLALRSGVDHSVGGAGFVGDVAGPLARI